MKFKDVLLSGEEIDCELIVGDSEMPASFVWNEDSTITEYGKKVFEKLLEAEIKRLDNGNIETFCNDVRLGTKFVTSVAGYIAESEYNKLFECDPKSTLLSLIKSFDNKINTIEICRKEDLSKECIDRAHLINIVIDEDSGPYGNYSIYLDTLGNKWMGDSGDFQHGVLSCLSDDEINELMYGEFIGALRRFYVEFEKDKSTLSKPINWVGSFIHD